MPLHKSKSCKGPSSAMDLISAGLALTEHRKRIAKLSSYLGCTFDFYPAVQTPRAKILVYMTQNIYTCTCIILGSSRIETRVPAVI